MGRDGLMSATELDEVRALIERVLPDPAGYAQRLLLQVMTQFGPGAEAGATGFYQGASAFYSATTDQDVTASEMVITPDQHATHEVPVDTNILLAAALGACECWGMRANCHLCHGLGTAGWTEPVPELFEEFVGPAIAKLSRIPGGEHERHATKSDGERENPSTRLGREP
jgi:hypothetical protein